ncbi:hypothetical protein KKB28_02485 [bacterium]|nr:hypothetical protein [bacterium]
MRNRQFITLILLAFFVAVASISAAPRYKERRSTDDLERVHVRGKVTRIEGQKATIRTESGAHVNVHLGPKWYWREHGYQLRTGSYVDVRGYGEFYEEDEGGYIYPYEIEGEGYRMDLADEYGYPRWAPDDGYSDGWYPSRGFYQDYYYCPPPPPPPPPPRWYSHHPRYHRYGPRYGYVWEPRRGWHRRPCRPHFGIHVGFWWP